MLMFPLENQENSDSFDIFKSNRINEAPPSPVSALNFPSKRMHSEHRSSKGPFEEEHREQRHELLLPPPQWAPAWHFFVWEERWISLGSAMVVCCFRKMTKNVSMKKMSPVFACRLQLRTSKKRHLSLDNPMSLSFNRCHNNSLWSTKVFETIYITTAAK